MPFTLRQSLFTHHFPLAALAASLAVSPALIGCAANSASSTDASDTQARDQAVREQLEQQTAASLSEVERRYLIGPTAARDLGYRIDWQYTAASQQAKIFQIDQDSVFLLDRRNFLTRIDRAQGLRIWSLPVAEPVLDVQGVTYVQEEETIYLTAGGSVLILDALNGSQTGRQRLQRNANTAPARFGQFLIYGAQAGQAVWHSFAVGYEWRAYDVSRTIRLQPVLLGDLLVVVGGDGRVMTIHAPSASMRWDKRLLAPVTARPAVGLNAVYVAGLDQHIWAYDITTGRNLWRYLTESPLTAPPHVHGENVYQYVPDIGLVAFVGRPIDRPGGEVLWTASEVRGNVIGGRQGRLFAWDAQAKRLTILDERSGGVIQEIDMPEVMEIRIVGVNSDELYAFGEGGRITRLVAR